MSSRSEKRKLWESKNTKTGISWKYLRSFSEFPVTTETDRENSFVHISLPRKAFPGGTVQHASLWKQIGPTQIYLDFNKASVLGSSSARRTQWQDNQLLLQETNQRVHISQMKQLPFHSKPEAWQVLLLRTALAVTHNHLWWVKVLASFLDWSYLHGIPPQHPI